MGCLSTFKHRKSTKKFLKKLGGLLDQPETYLKILNEFWDKYMKYKDKRYSNTQIEELMDKLLESNGYRLRDDIMKELETKRNVIRPDNFIILELKQRIEIMEDRYRDLQSFVLKEKEDLTEYKMNTENKILMLKNKTEIKEKRRFKNRTRIVVDNNESKEDDV